MASPRVSVVIPNYNHADYLGDAIESVLSQDLRDFEVIVVDDGSTDLSRQVVDRYGDLVRYIWQENRGLSSARNTGIAAARGELIALLDADDLYHPRFLASLVSKLDEEPDAAAVYCGYQFVDAEKGKLPQASRKVVPPEQLYSLLALGNFLSANSVVVRKKVYAQVGPFDETLRACEDWDMWLRIAKDYQAVGVPESLTYTRVLESSMSSDINRMEYNRLLVARKNFGLENEDVSDWSGQQRWVFASIYLKSALEYLEQGDEEAAYPSFRKAITLQPEMLDNRDLFYELSCSHQVKGYRGALKHLDLAAGSQRVFRFLDRFFNDDTVPAELYARRNSAYAKAHFVLGFLGFVKDQRRPAVKHLLAAIRFHPAYSVDTDWVRMAVRTLIGRRAWLVARDFSRGTDFQRV